MNKLLLSAVSICATGALAAGIDQSGQPVLPLFEDGNHAEISITRWVPSLDGVWANGARTRTVYDPITDVAGAIKLQFNRKWSGALLIDQPYGIDVAYPASDFLFAGTGAVPDSTGVTVLARYKFTDRVSVHGGVRATRFGGEVVLPAAAYDWKSGGDWGYGYVIGGAYEVPEIALRVALTYGSETRHQLDATETIGGMVLDSTTEITMPQSVNLDFQTGVAAKTLLFGGVRWSNWRGWDVSPDGFQAATGQPLVEFRHDGWLYKVGLGRQLTERFSAAVQVNYEAAQHEAQTIFDPKDGLTAIVLGGTYKADHGFSFTGGVSYTVFGNAGVIAGDQQVARFEDNHATAAALRISYDF